MTTSGTYTFAMSRNDLIGAALRLTQAFGDQDAIPASDIINCSQALNVMVKEMVVDGLPLWCIQEVVIPLVSGQATYNLSTAAGMPLPPRVLDVLVRDSSGDDTSLTLMSRDEYRSIGNKASAGTPIQFYYDPQLSGGILTLYNVPNDATMSLRVSIQRQIQDFNLATENPDFPQESYRFLKWCLADEIALEYQTPLEVRQEINQKANGFKDKYFNFSREEAAVFFQPSGRWGG